MPPAVQVWTFLALIAVQGPFFLTQWEERHTHTCRTNTGGVGVTEGQWVSIIVLLITGLWGGDFWQYPLRVWAPAPILLTMESVFGPGVGDLMANQCLAILLVIRSAVLDASRGSVDSHGFSPFFFFHGIHTATP